MNITISKRNFLNQTGTSQTTWAVKIQYAPYRFRYFEFLSEQELNLFLDALGKEFGK